MMAPTFALTQQPIRATGTQRQPMYLALDVSGFDGLDVELMCNIEGTAANAAITLVTGMALDTESGWSAIPANFAPISGTGQQFFRVSIRGGLFRYLRWDVGSLGGASAITFFLKALGRVGLPAVITPNDLPSCAFWVRSDLGITFQALTTNVRVWANQASTGTAYDLSQTIDLTHQAAYHSGGLNNQPYLSFTTSPFVGYNWSYAAGAGAKTIVAVLRLTSLDGAGHTLYQIYNSGSGATCELILDLATYSMTSFTDANTTGNMVGFNDALGTTKGHIHLHTYDGIGSVNSTSSYTGSFDGVAKTLATSGAYGSTGISSAVGVRPNATLPLAAEVYELIVYERVLSAGEQGSLVAYLKSRYAL
jgi:hypothetical protein